MNPKILMVMISAFLLLSNIVLAVPGNPHFFYGSVILNGNPAPDGTIVSAKINGIVVASIETSGGNYGLDSDGEPGTFFIDDPNNIRAGQEITFFINDVNTGQTEYFVNNGFTNLDLSVTIESSSGTTTNGGGGSIGGSATIITTNDSSSTTSTSSTTQEEGCQEKWTCSDWGECVDGIQTRVCADENQCGTNSREPFSSQPCSTVLSSTEETPGSPIGFFMLSSTDLLLAGVVGLIVAIVIIFIIKMRKQKSIVHVVKMDQTNQVDQVSQATDHSDSSDHTDSSKSGGIEP